MAEGYNKKAAKKNTQGTRRDKFALSEEQLQTLRARWQKGEKLAALAAEVGTTWMVLAGYFTAQRFHKSFTREDTKAYREQVNQKAKAKEVKAAKASKASQATSV